MFGAEAQSTKNAFFLNRKTATFIHLAAPGVSSDAPNTHP
jgi:hypothetical protein